MRFGWAVGVLALVVGACGGEKSATKSEVKSKEMTGPRTHTRDIPILRPSTPPKPIRVPDLKSLRVRSTGKGKKVKLRYDIAQTAPNRLDIVLDEVKTRELKSRQWTKHTNLPQIKYGMSLQMQKANDSYSLRWRGLSPEIADTKDASANAAAQAVVKSFTDHIAGQRGAFTVSPRGEIGDMEAINAATPLGERSKEEAENLIWQTMIPLPEEAVGVGARWDAHIVLLKGDVVVKQRSRYTIKSINGSRLLLAVEIRQISTPQKILVPGTKDQFIDLAAALRVVQGEMTVDLAHSVLPRGRDLLFEHRYHIKAKSEAGEQDYAYEASGKLSILGSKGPREVARR